MALNMTFTNVGGEARRIQELVSYFKANGYTLRFHQKPHMLRTVVRVELGNMNMLEMEIDDTDLYHPNLVVPVSIIEGWLQLNSVAFTGEATEELVKELPKKRVRMGKWGIKKEHING